MGFRRGRHINIIFTEKGCMKVRLCNVSSLKASFMCDVYAVLHINPLAKFRPIRRLQAEM